MQSIPQIKSPRNKESGQGLVEYALIAVLCLVVVIVIAAIVWPFLFNTDNPCHRIGATEFECQDYKVNQCLETEKYTKEQCIDLVRDSDDD